MDFTQWFMEQTKNELIKKHYRQNRVELITRPIN